MEKLNNILAAHVAQGSDTKDKLLGAAFTVVNAQGVLYQGSAGRVDLDPSSAPWGPGTLSWIASMTKLASVIAVLQVVEQGLVTLDEDLRPRIGFLAEVEIIRGFDAATRRPVLEPNTAPITLRQLLTHTVGLAYDLSEELLMKWRHAVGKDLINMTWTEEGFSTPLLFAPGSDWHYGTGIDWAVVLLERATGTKISAYMAEHVFGPLDMRSTGFWPAELAAVPCRVPGGALAGAPSPVPAAHPVESGGAGLFSTAADYGKLLRGVLARRLLARDESWQLLFAPQLGAGLQARMQAKVRLAQAVYAAEFGPETPVSFAFGGMVNLADVPGKRSKGSIQWSGYTNPHWWIDREKGVAAVLQVSLLPPGDPVVVKLYDELERAVYAELLAGRSVSLQKSKVLSAQLLSEGHVSTVRSVPAGGGGEETVSTAPASFISVHSLPHPDSSGGKPIGMSAEVSLFYYIIFPAALLPAASIAGGGPRVNIGQVCLRKENVDNPFCRADLRRKIEHGLWHSGPISCHTRITI